MKQDHVRAEQKYDMLRDAVYEATMDRYGGLEAKTISLHAALQADQWKNHAAENSRPFRAGRSWQQAFSSYQNKPNRFEISLWQAGELGSLCYGQSSRSNNRVRLDLIESSPLRPKILGRASLPVLTFASSIDAKTYS